jgi:polysaccharide biosynthesis protein PelC
MEMLYLISTKKIFIFEREVNVLSKTSFLLLIFFLLTGCVPAVTNMYNDLFYQDENMDFGAVRRVAVMPFVNMTREQLAAERVRDVFTIQLLASEAVYVIPTGETMRGINRITIANPAVPSPEELVQLAHIVNVDAVITGAVREYGEIRSSQSTANIISISVSMLEAQTGKIVWTASSTKGGIGMSERLFGGGGRPMDDVTQEAVRDVLDKLFK